MRCHGILFTTSQKNEPIVLRRNVQQLVEPLPKASENLSPEPNYGALDNGQTM
jgi:hypothetical protein